MRKQHGYAGHFIAASSCLFHLHTTAGAFRVSTVGDYHPQYARGPGDALGERQQIGCDRYFETMVFLLGDDGEPLFWSELDTLGYNEAPEAEAGHELLVRKYERLELPPGRSLKNVDALIAHINASPLREEFADLIATLEYQRELREEQSDAV